MSSTPPPPDKAVRRRASRAAGPASGSAAGTTSIRLKEAEAPAKRPKRAARSSGPPPRREPNRRLVAWSALASGFVAVVVAGVLVGLMVHAQNQTKHAEERRQRFVDTASQTVVNMFSFNQDSLEESVDRFVSGTSGPLRDMMSVNNNAENLKAIFRDTSASSEAVINGAAFEKEDPVSGNASVLVSVRVTVSDLHGNNKPSQPYRMRVVVHEDENGDMTTYDLKYPDGGN